MKEGNLLTHIYFLGQGLLVFFFSSCFMFPVTPTKSQLHRIVESCILNSTGCVGGSSLQPEINIQANNIDYLNNSTFDFGTVPAFDPAVDVVFTIQNLGQSNLSLTSSINTALHETDPLAIKQRTIASAVIPVSSIVVVSGTNASFFTITQPTVTSVSSGASTTFTVSFATTLQGSNSASISISNNDTDENPYTINLTATGGIPK